jgi:hypothetical protein
VEAKIETRDQIFPKFNEFHAGKCSIQPFSSKYKLPPLFEKFSIRTAESDKKIAISEKCIIALYC